MQHASCYRAVSRCAVPLLAAGLIGCAGPNAQLARCQTEKQELLAVIEREKAHAHALEERTLALQSRLDQSEKELAQLVRPGTRFATDDENRTAAKPVRPLDPPRSAAPIREPNPGKSPAGLREMKLQAPAGGTHAPQASESRLAALAQRDTRLEYDPAAGTARFQIDVPFSANGAQLTAQARQRLDELAAWLKTPQTAHLRVLVAGHSSGMSKPPAGADAPRFASDRELAAARALAVADYLDSHGIKENRLAIAGSGSKRSAASSPGAVEILLAEPETPVAGIWPAGTIRR